MVQSYCLFVDLLSFVTERSKTIEEKYKDLMQQYVTQTTEIQTYMSDRAKLKKKFAEKNSNSNLLEVIYNTRKYTGINHLYVNT